MKAEEFIADLSDVSRRNVYRFDQLRACIPLGKDSLGNFTAAHREQNPARYHYVCVTGAERTKFIHALVLTLACVYDKSEAMFLALSPRDSYGELLRLKFADVTVPYIRSISDCTDALTALKELLRARKEGSPRLFLIADGLEELPDAAKDGTLSAYRACFEAVGTSGAELITGADIAGSMYAGYPGTFVGIGNCLVTPKGQGKADVAYVNPDSALAPPKEIYFPDEPDFSACIDYFNALV